MFGKNLIGSKLVRIEESHILVVPILETVKYIAGNCLNKQALSPLNSGLQDRDGEK